MSEAHKYKYLDPAALAKMGRLNIVAKGVVEGFITGLHRSPYHGFSVEFAEHREYVAGDNPKDVDWQAYGRSDRYMIKQYQEETNLRAYLLLDISGSMGYRSEESSISKLEYGCYLAACLAFLLARQQDPVGLVTFDDEVRTFMPPGSTTVHLNLLLRQLEKLSPGRTTNVSSSFHHLAEHIKRRGLTLAVGRDMGFKIEESGVTRELRDFRLVPGTVHQFRSGNGHKRTGHHTEIELISVGCHRDVTHTESRADQSGCKQLRNVAWWRLSEVGPGEDLVFRSRWRGATTE